MNSENISQLDSKKYIIIKGAKLNNLKNIDVFIPRNKLVVITGLSGSGKSTLAFDTLYAEGQRRYVESLSSYARQFLGKLNKPKVDFIKGIAPAVAIEQKVNTTNARSTVGTSTEIYDYLKLLFARIGKTHSPKSGVEVIKHQVKDVVDYLLKQEEKSKWLLLSPLVVNEKRTLQQTLNLLLQQGFQRIYTNKKIVLIDEILNFDEALKTLKSKDIYIVVDRIIIKNEEDFVNRLADAVQMAFYEGKGECMVMPLEKYQPTNFNNKFSMDGIDFIEPTIHLFSFNNPFGACEICNGYGNVIGIDEELVIPNTSLSIFESAIAPWKGESMSWYKEQLVMNAYKFDFPIHKPYFELSKAEKNLLWKGNHHFTGLDSFFNELEEKNYKIQNRVMLSRYRGKTTCKSCGGKRLRKEANYVKINDFSISDLVDLPIVKLIPIFENLSLTSYEKEVSKRLLIEIKNRLNYLDKVGLGYLTLNRSSATLSGGESQRINLATSLGSNLVGSMYILDEPSIGLHSKDTEKLIEVLFKLRDLGNTVIVVEHDEDIMKQADHIIDIGPEAGSLGGELVAEGSYDVLLKKDTLTAKYLNQSLKIGIPKQRRLPKNFIEIIGAKENNLKNIDVKFPLDCFAVVTGVSGSGKSTLVKKILYPALQKSIIGIGDKTGQFHEIKGNFSHIKILEYVDQNPIGKSSRSNPITYIKAYDDIRELYATQKLSKIRNYQAKHFSFNVDGGRCPVCNGDGEIIVEMQFMADVHLTCEACDGKRFKKEILEVKFEEKSIDDLLNMTIDDALSFFKEQQKTKIYQKLKPLQDVGLGYVKLGQSSSTLSGGEAQRVKLATFLGKGNNKEKTLFLFDEPTTGLHFHDIKKLLISFEALIENGHSIIVIEHNVDLIKCADYVIDLGPEGGENGGYFLASGTPEEIVKNKLSITGKYLKTKL